MLHTCMSENQEEANEEDLAKNKLKAKKRNCSKMFGLGRALIAMDVIDLSDILLASLSSADKVTNEAPDAKQLCVYDTIRCKKYQ